MIGFRHLATIVLASVIILMPTILRASADGYTVSGRVIDKQTRKGVAYAAVYIDSQTDRSATADSLGHFSIHNVRPAICRIVATSLGYKTAVTPEYIISASTPFVEIEIEEDATQVDAVTVTLRQPLFRHSAESPVSMRTIGLREIEKSPGSNRDVSRIVRSYPGVAYSPAGYRNDLIVRGGSPLENGFYMDDIEIPNINHFATQGASGGPVSIVNSDLVREIKFYTGAFPAQRGGVMSSVLDFTLRDGNAERQQFKATLGASEVGVSGSGHIGERTTYLFSLRQSYLQLLFKMLGLPFLPNYIDGQVKIKTRFNQRNELTLLALSGIDNMRLNTDQTGESAEYILSYLPHLRQETFTVGGVYRHYAGKHVQSVTLSYSYLNNRNIKYRDNDSSSPENLILKLRGVEGKATLRFDNKTFVGRWNIREGVEINSRNYNNRTFQQRYIDGNAIIDYRTSLNFVGWGIYALADYTSADERFTASAGLRTDANGYSDKMSRFWQQLSPRAALSYAFSDRWSLSGSAGIYYQTPPLTALGFKQDGELINRNLDFMQVRSAAVGLQMRLPERLVVSLEGFYKYYTRVPLSTADNIPLICKGNDYGTVGDEQLISTAQGQAYGLELMARWSSKRLNLVGSATLYKSSFRNDRNSRYIDSAWDNRFIANVSGTYDLPRNWSIGMKLSAIGGAPYTPYDIEKSSLKQYWDAYGKPAYDYDRYNDERLKAFAQLDLRIDKTYYFDHWMLGIYIDLQNVTSSKLKQPDVLMSSGVVENPEAPLSQQHYRMKYIKQDSGTLVPTLGVTVQF